MPKIKMSKKKMDKATLDKATLKALKGSILKWKKIVALKAGDKGTENCPLCDLFFGVWCEGCPVSEATGQPYCRDTPYEEYDSYDWVYNQKATTPRLMVAAKAELKFLKSLLPE